MVKILLSQKQIDSINHCDALVNLWCGAVRAGKSYASLWAFIKLCQKAPPGNLVIIGKTQDTIRRNIIEELKNPEAFPGISIKAKEGEISLEGRTVFLIGANDERAEGNIRGPTFVGGYVDEVTLINEAVWKMLVSRFSKEGARLLATTNPDSPFHWLKEEIDQQADKPELMKVFNFKMEDNPSLSPKYIQNMKNFYRGMWYKRYIEGQWCLAEGTVYSGFSEAEHVIDEPPTYAKYYIVGVDHGVANAFAALIIGFNDETPGAKIWVEREYYYESKVAGQQKSDFEYSEALEAFLQGYPIKAMYIDSAAASFKQELRRRGCLWPIIDVKKDVHNGIQEVATRLYTGDLRVLRCCRSLIKEFYSYVWDETKVKKGKDEPVKANDHALDALRYAIYTRWGGKKELKEATEQERKVEMFERMQQQTSPWNARMNFIKRR